MDPVVVCFKKAARNAASRDSTTDHASGNDHDNDNDSNADTDNYGDNNNEHPNVIQPEPSVTITSTAEAEYLQRNGNDESMAVGGQESTSLQLPESS